MNKKEMQFLCTKLFNDKIDLSELEEAYVDSVNSGKYHDSVFYAFLGYFRARMKDDPEILEVLGFVQSAIELLLAKKKDIPKKIKKKPQPKGPFCSFCGKSNDEVQKLIAGPSVFICNECVGVCGDILTKPKKSPSLKKLKNKTKTTRRK